MVPANEAGGRGLWEEKPGIYLKMSFLGAQVYALDPAMLHSPQQGAPAARKQEDQLGTGDAAPQHLALCCLRPLGRAQRAEAADLARLVREGTDE